MRCYIGGVNGAGKTTLLDAIKVRFPEIEILKGSKVFMEYLGIPGDYGALRALPMSEAGPKFEEMISKILLEKENFIFDAHYLNIVNGKIKRVSEDWIQKFDAIILLDISAETALKRIANENRDRALFPEGMSKEEEIKMYSEYIEATRKDFQDIVSVRNIPHLIIDGEKELDEKVEDFGRFYKSDIFDSIKS